MDLNNPIFKDETKAREHLEGLRWGEGRFCPHCGEAEKTSPVEGKSHRPGLYYCLSCKKTFTVTVGTLFERSKIPLTKWVLAFHLMNASKKGISAHQLHRMLGVTYKTAWFMAHRIREAMGGVNTEPMGGNGEVVEVDETFIGNKPGRKKGARGTGHKHAVLSLVTRNGEARSFHVGNVKAKTLMPILRKNVRKNTQVMTDEAKQYHHLDETFADHQFVTHSAEEYVRDMVHTNTVEGFFSIFKRGMKGVYQHCGEQHLQRYLNEFDFRYSNRKITDAERAALALAQIGGKRLTYRRTDKGQAIN